MVLDNDNKNGYWFMICYIILFIFILECTISTYKKSLL